VGFSRLNWLLTTANAQDEIVIPYAVHQMPHRRPTRPQSSVIPDVGNEMICTIRLRPSNIAGYGDPEALFQVVNCIESDESQSFGLPPLFNGC